MIYVVNGFPESGKTTFEDMVCKIIGNGVYGFKISTVDFVKEVAKYCGWDGTKTPKNRKFLSDLKDILTDWNDIPCQQIKKFIEKKEDEFLYYGVNFSKAAIFIDSREPQEIERLCKELGAKSILITRPNNNVELSNHADKEVLNYKYDITILNDGSIEDLQQKAIEFVKQENLNYSTYMIGKEAWSF